MDYICGVEVFDCAEEIVDYCLNVLDLKMDGTLDNFLQVGLCQFKHYI